MSGKTPRVTVTQIHYPTGAGDSVTMGNIVISSRWKRQRFVVQPVPAHQGPSVSMGSLEANTFNVALSIALVCAVTLLHMSFWVLIFMAPLILATSHRFLKKTVMRVEKDAGSNLIRVAQKVADHPRYISISELTSEIEAAEKSAREPYIISASKISQANNVLKFTREIDQVKGWNGPLLNYDSDETLASLNTADRAQAIVAIDAIISAGKDLQRTPSEYRTVPYSISGTIALDVAMGRINTATAALRALEEYAQRVPAQIGSGSGLDVSVGDVNDALAPDWTGALLPEHPLSLPAADRHTANEAMKSILMARQILSLIPPDARTIETENGVVPHDEMMKVFATSMAVLEGLSRKAVAVQADKLRALSLYVDDSAASPDPALDLSKKTPTSHTSGATDVTSP